MYQPAIPIKNFQLSSCAALQTRSVPSIFAHLADVLCLDGPGADLPLCLQVTVNPGFAHNACGRRVWELDAVFGQMQIVQSVFLTWNTSQRTINQNLQLICDYRLVLFNLLW